MSLESEIGELRGKLEARDETERAASAQMRKELDEIFVRLRTLEGDKKHDDGVIDGITMALAKVGTAVVLALAGIGWLIVNGVPDFIKRSLH